MFQTMSGFWKKIVKAIIEIVLDLLTKKKE